VALDAAGQSATPEVTVLLPVYNGADTVVAAAQSVLTEDHCALELIIINDGSTDNTAEKLDEIASDVRVRVINRPNKGLSASLNEGITASAAPFIARMDADDVSMPGRFAAQLKFLTDHDDVVLVGGQIRRVIKGRPESTSDFPLEHSQIVSALIQGHHAICHPTIMVRKSALDVIGGYWEHGVAEDWDLFLRLSEIGRLANLSRHVLDYTFHEGGINATSMEQVRANIAFAVCNYRRRELALDDLDRVAYLRNVGLRERFRIRAQSRSLELYRRSLLVRRSSTGRAAVLLAAATTLWPPFAARRLTRALARRPFRSELSAAQG
jgi:glycosyltransferase involved in cell wall biosynthesis